MEIHVYETMEQCEGSLLTPSAVGVLYADGQCNTVETSEDVLASTSYRLLPGTYSAHCTAMNENANGTQMLRFIQSGCINPNCNSTIVGADVCSRDWDSEAALYSRLEVPEYLVQSSTSSYVQCSRLVGGDNITVTFVVFGDCSDPSCIETTSVGSPVEWEDASSVTNVTVSKPRAAPTAASTAKPVSSSSSTRKPTISPAPILSPTNSPKTEAPLTVEPSANPTIDFDEEKTEAPTAVPSYDPTASFRVESISVVMLLTKIVGIIEGQAAALWENVTATHIHQSAILEGYSIGSISTTKATQELLNDEKEIISSSILASLPPAANTSERFLQVSDETSTNITSEDDGDADGSARIYFDVTMSFPLTTPTTVTTARVFNDAFDTEVKRIQYIIKLVNTNDKTFESLESLTILDDGSGTFPSESPSLENNANTPTSGGKPTEDENTDEDGSSAVVIEPVSTGKDKNTLTIIGVLSGVLVLFIACGYLIYHRGKRDAMSHSANNNDDKKSSTTSGSSPINNQRWTNEIIIDPSADDVSTLGGSVLHGLQLSTVGGADNGMGIDGGDVGDTPRVCTDEPTASVNVDYDFTRNQYRTGALNEDATIDDVNTRFTKESAFTTLSRLGIGAGMNQSICFADDDISFERQYQEECATEGDGYENEDKVGDARNDGGDSRPPNIDTLKALPNVNNLRSRTTTPTSSLLMMIPSSLSSPLRNKNATPSSPSSAQLSRNTSSQLQQHFFEVTVPPGILGMVVDTPGGTMPVVRAVKSTSCLCGTVQIGDQLLSVDSIDVTTMSAMQVSNLISTRSHLHRTLRFVRIMTATSPAAATISPQAQVSGRNYQ